MAFNLLVRLCSHTSSLDCTTSIGDDKSEGRSANGSQNWAPPYDAVGLCPQQANDAGAYGLAPPLFEDRVTPPAEHAAAKGSAGSTQVSIPPHRLVRLAKDKEIHALQGFLYRRVL